MAGEYLVKENYADKAKLVIHGGSHGGFLVREFLCHLFF